MKKAAKTKKSEKESLEMEDNDGVKASSKTKGKKEDDDDEDFPLEEEKEEDDDSEEDDDDEREETEEDDDLLDESKLKIDNSLDFEDIDLDDEDDGYYQEDNF